MYLNVAPLMIFSDDGGTIFIVVRTASNVYSAWCISHTTYDTVIFKSVSDILIIFATLYEFAFIDRHRRIRRNLNAFKKAKRKLNRIHNTQANRCKIYRKVAAPMTYPLGDALNDAFMGRG
jgi:hypothetical protein